MVIKFKCIFLFLVSIVMNVFSQSDIISIWGNNIPNVKGLTDMETVEETDIIRISNVSEPTLEIFLPAKKSIINKAVVICPGGGYKYLSYDWEGTDVAKWFNSKGIAAFVLKYRLPEESICNIPHEAPLQDAQRALRWVRQNSERFQIDKNKIGIIGFSAGGHLASTLGTSFNASNNFEEQSIDTISARPDFMILMYPVITMSGESTHKGSRTNLLGKNPSDALKKLYSNELNVSVSTPPTFIVHATDDVSVPVENSLLFYKALKDNGVKAEMHIYPYGGHGFGLAIGKGYLQSWTTRLYGWLLEI